MKRVILAAALALAACGQGQQSAPPQTAELTVAHPGDTLRAQVGSYYFDFVERPAMARYAPNGLDLGAGAARFERNMQTSFPSAIVTANGLEALVFAGCAAHACGGITAGVLAIDLATGDAFAGVKDEEGETVLKPNARLQMLLTQTSPSGTWSDPRLN